VPLREVVTRTLDDLKADGLVRLERDGVAIRDPTAFSDVAEQQERTAAPAAP
jgi:hypothetical protein